MGTILIVDGQRTSRQYLASILGFCGHRLIEADDAVAALKILETENPDIVISDVLMRMMDGYEFAEKLRARLTPAPPVIFFVPTRYAMETHAEASGCGVHHVISKSSKPELIISTVDSLLSQQSNRPVFSPKIALDRFRFVPPADSIDANAVVYVVDDDLFMRRLLSMIITSSQLQVKTFESAESFLDSYDNAPGCLLTDVQMPGMSGVSLLAALRARRMSIPTIILTGHGELEDAKLAMRFGVMDFLDKAVNRRTLMARIYGALQDDTNQRRGRTDAETNQHRLASLTARERDLVQLLIEGHASKEIAAALKISTKTVAIHRSHLMAKTGALNVADLVRMSMIARDV